VRLPPAKTHAAGSGGGTTCTRTARTEIRNSASKLAPAWTLGDRVVTYSAAQLHYRHVHDSGERESRSDAAVLRGTHSVPGDAN
jgi:hypothetical protein